MSNLWPLWNRKPADLWKKHRVRKITDRDVQVMCLPELNSETLNGMIEQRNTVKPFPTADLERHKVGVLHAYPGVRSHILACCPLSWAMYVLGQERTGELSRAESFHRLAVSVMVTTVDRLYVLAKRSAVGVENYPNVWHVSAAGYVDCRDLSSGDALRSAAWRELSEEMTLTASDTSTLELLGMCEHLTPGKSIYEVCFRTCTHLSASHVLQRAADASDAWEGKHHAYSATEVTDLLRREKFNPAGAATLMMSLGI